MISAELITTDGDLDALRPAWDALWQTVPNATAFSSPAWMLAWWRVFGTSMPRVAVLRASETLLGLLPLYVLQEQDTRKLLPIGIGITDDLSPLLAPDAPVGTMQRLLELALRDHDRITECDLTAQTASSPLRSIAPPPGWEGVWYEADPCPVLDLSSDMRDVVPARMRRKLRMNSNRARLLGGFTIETATANTLDAHLNALIALHTARWRAEGQDGVLADPNVQAFHRIAAPELLETGRLRLQSLWIRGRVAAVIYALLSGNSIQFYLSGYDADFASVSPGSLLLAAMLENAAQEGRMTANFLRGNEAYKYAWGAQDRWNACLSLRPCQA